MKKIILSIILVNLLGCLCERKSERGGQRARSGTGCRDSACYRSCSTGCRNCRCSTAAAAAAAAEAAAFRTSA